MQPIESDSAQSAVLLALNGVSKHFGEFTAVDDVSFAVPSGSIVGLLGPNGAGKTTLLSMLIGLFPPSTGTITLCGEEYTHVPAEAKHLFGFVPDSQEVLSSLTGYEYLSFLGSVYSLSEEQLDSIDTYLAILRMEQKAHDMMETYSHGQRKKLQFIGSLLHNPQLLLMDEPFSGLDPEMVALTKTLVRKLRDRGVGILLSTHDLAMAEGLCDTVIFLNHGKVLAHGSTKSILVEYQAETLEEAFLKALGLDRDIEELDRVLAGF
jgi:ABC-2 type transport system ATP-binding protein